MNTLGIRLLGIVVACMVQGACMIPGPMAPKDAVRSLVRDQASVFADDDQRRAIELSYLRGGDSGAPRIIFLHGSPGNAMGWADYLVDPPIGFEAIAVDRPGFGDTQPGEALPRLRDQARVLEALLVARSERFPILVGHSLGAPIAAQTAIEFPDRVGGLVLLAGSLDPDLEHVIWIQRVGRWRGVEWLLPSWARNANRELTELEADLRRLAPRLPEVRCPVVIVHGTDDSLVPYANVSFILDAFRKNTRVDHIRLDGHDHFLPWNAQKVVREALAQVIELRGSRSRSPRRSDIRNASPSRGQLSSSAPR